MSELERQGQYVRRDGLPPVGGLAAAIAGGRRRRRRAGLVVGSGGAAVVLAVVLAAVAVAAPSGGHDARVEVAAPTTSPDAPSSSAPVVTTSTPPSTPAASSTSAAPSTTAEEATTPAAPSTSAGIPNGYRPQTITVTVTGPTTAEVGEPVTFTATIGWSAARPEQIAWCGPPDRTGHSSCVGVGECTSAGGAAPVAAVPGTTTVTETLTFDRPGTYTANVDVATLRCGDYWRGEAGAGRPITVVGAPSSTSTPPATTTSPAAPTTSPAAG